MRLSSTVPLLIFSTLDWRTTLIDELRDHIKDFLTQHPFGILCTNGSAGAWAAPFWQYSHDLELICLLQRWSDVLYHIEQDPRVQIMILDPRSSNMHWLQMRGTARSIDTPDWSKLILAGDAPGQPERYVAVRFIPQRIDLFDESKGWGACETLEF